MDRSRAALTGRFRTVVRVPSFACPKERTKKKTPSSAPASPVHSDAHVKAMRQKTHIAFAMFKHFAAPHLRRLQQRTKYSAGDPVLRVEPEPAVGALWFGPTPHLPSRICICSPFRAGADVQAAWVSGAPRQRGQLSEHRQSDASSGRIPGNLCGCARPRSGRICRGSFPLVTFVWTSKRK